MVLLQGAHFVRGGIGLARLRSTAGELIFDFVNGPVLAVATLVVFVLPPLSQELEVRRETWPNGDSKAEYQCRDQDGTLVLDGEYQSWFENGARESHGRYRSGERHGSWEFWHPGGGGREKGRYARGMRMGKWRARHPNGSKAWEGSYEDGRRSGRWKFWDAEGGENVVDSGEYTWDEGPAPHGKGRYAGYRVDGFAHGRWEWSWEDGTPQFSGEFSRGQRGGEWTLHYRDGTPAREFLSGVYEEGNWKQSLAQQESGGAWRVPSVEALPESWPEVPARAESRIDELLAMTREDLAALVEESEGQPLALVRDLTPAVCLLPIGLTRLLRCDPDSPEGRESVRRIDVHLLRQASGGHGLGPVLTEEAGAEQVRERMRAWACAWELGRANEALWWLDLQLPIDVEVPHKVSPLRDPAQFGFGVGQPEEGAYPKVFAARIGSAKLDESDREATGLAGQWLAWNQLPDGRWTSTVSDRASNRPAAEPYKEHIPARYDCGVTGLALLALMADPVLLETELHRSSVIRGAAWLARQQDAAGIVRDRIAVLNKNDYLSTISLPAWGYEHAIATAALAEALVLLDLEALRPIVDRAVALIHAMRNRDAVWRYEMPPDGENDTSVTGWMLLALVSAEAAGIEVDPQCGQDALQWLRAVTDERTHRVGYDGPGTASARVREINMEWPAEMGEPMTALALFTRLLIEPEFDGDAMAENYAELILRRPPEWHEKWGSDMYYLYWASHAMSAMGGAAAERWHAELRKNLLPKQRKDEWYLGSWDPAGPWGWGGGRVYATAMMRLSLLAPGRLQPSQ